MNIRTLARNCLSFVLFFALSFVKLPAQSPEESTSGWYPFSPAGSASQGVIGMASWLDAPAGKHGFASLGDDRIVFEDGKAIKFWGTNICSRLPFVSAREADEFVDFIANYGMNSVRFHKFSWFAYHNGKSTEFAPDKFIRFDYFQSKLRQKGIYYGWSHIYGHRVMPGDSSRLLAYSEVKNLEYPWAHLNGSTASLVNFAPDLQDLSIDLTVNMLNHVNPHTGLRYADDPALAFIEFQNEDNIFWAAIGKSLEQAPTYRRLLYRQFSKWLKSRYGNQEKLEAAWGPGRLPAGQSLEMENIDPDPNHGLFSGEYERALKTGHKMRTDLLDKMRFLYETQLTFYRKFEKAVRETGYKGLLIGSCWQAGSGLSHLYNLHTDYEIGMIDRHNYFGGGAGGHRLAEGNVRNNSLLAQPGSGLLSTGLQDVVNRPFSFSEWMSMVPNEWTAEAAPLIALYGMGLQGWDASFSFATDIPRFSGFLQSEAHGVYNATSPLHIGLYPALARLIYRGDVKESPVLATRNAHIPSLEQGKLSFTELVRQGYDDKSFSGTVSPEMLAVGRFPIRFTDEFTKTELPDVSKYWDKDKFTLKSVTGELTWRYGEKKYVTVNTLGTKGMAGFAGGEKLELGDWKIETPNLFSVVLITDLTPKGNLSETDSLLVTTIARARNTGMTYDYTEGKTVLTALGTAPLLLEPVNVTISAGVSGDFEVIPLDHDGRITTKRISVRKGTFELDGRKDKTMYYLIVRNKAGK